jgi:hypothetical protein
VVLNGYIFVSQAYAFSMCKCSLEWVHICASSICILCVQVQPWLHTCFFLKYMHSICASVYTFPEVWCLKHMHLVCASPAYNGYTFPEVWCLKHMHSVCASAAFKACIFPKVWCLKHMHLVCASAASPKAKWARKWKLAGAVLRVWGACLCKCGIQHSFIFQVMMIWTPCTPACVASMPVQVWPSISLYFLSYGPSNTCILYLQLRAPVKSPADACTCPRNRGHFTSPTRNACW